MALNVLLLRVAASHVEAHGSNSSAVRGDSSSGNYVTTTISRSR